MRNSFARGSKLLPKMACAKQTLPWFQRGYRRMLVDMHIPDWDERFLSKYDPVKMADLYELAGLTSVMFYCQSHVGLCYWPTKTGKMHAGLHGRDIVGELLRELKTRGLASCAYYSLIYNNWAFLEHPQWRIQPAGESSDGSFAGFRYGQCCPNNPGYREFALAQTEELVSSYDFDGLYFDMTFWPAICLCAHCRNLFRKEAGRKIPSAIDWFSKDWCAFQSARERWLSQFAATLTAKAKTVNPNLSVYHNLGPSIFNWTLGVPFASAVHHDFLGADFYGDPIEQFLVSKFMLNLTNNRPLEFQTSRCINLRDHVRMKPREAMQMQAFAATLFSSAFLFIDAINIDGTVNPAVYERIRKIYQETACYEPYLGGEQVEDIGIYFSSDSKMDFLENGTPVGKSPMWGRSYPHMKAVRGVCRMLQQAHLPFGIITRRQLATLDRYRVVVLPNVLRMDREEVEAFRAYARRGGRLYASRYTSLTETRGTRHADFLMSDVFGCCLEADDLGMITYLKPSTKDMAECITPQDYVSNFPLGLPWGMEKESSAGTLRLKKRVKGVVLATLSLPYASPAHGTVFDKNWASIHSSPPWEDTNHPVIVGNRFGKGRVIYSAADIESVDSEVNSRLFLSLMKSLLGKEPSYAADCHPAVWMNVFHQKENAAFLIGFLNYQSQLPAIPISRISFSLRSPEGKHFTRLLALPKETPVAFTVDAEGVLHAETRDLEVFQLLRAQYET